MLDSLQIKGFKLFRELTVPKLARLNLFVGANNSGKSCLLEAVRLHESGGSTNVIRDLVRSRDGQWEAKLSDRASEAEDATTGVEDPIRFLFHNFHCRIAYDFSGRGWGYPIIQIGEIDTESKLRISLGLYRKVRANNLIGDSLVPVDFSTTAPMLAALGVRRQPADDEIEMLQVSVNGQDPTPHSLERLWAQQRLSGIWAPLSADISRGIVRTVGTGNLTPNEVSFLWDNVSLTPQQDRILDCLRLIEPRIEGLALIGQSGRAGDRIPVVKLAGETERLPLKVMGDGLTRLFHIALAMVNAENGVLLIDEFENGLYWEVQEQLWPVIFKMAEELNVQVFATTHSNDCLKSFVNAWSERPELGSIYRLERSGDSTRAYLLPIVNISGALASEIEVR